MRLDRVLSTTILITATVGVLSAIGYSAIGSAHPNPTSGQAGGFTVWTAIAVLGYVLFPVLAALAVALLLVAALVLSAHAIERGRAAPEDPTSPAPPGGTSRWIVPGLAIVAAIAIGLALTALVVRPLDTPERRVEAYLSATRTGDDARALGAWVVFSRMRDPAPLLARRNDLTHELASARVGQTYTVRRTEWWRTCCEPGPIDSPRNAGLARMHVTATDASGRTYELVFEIFVRDITWWGDAGSPSTRDWTLYEVHREGDPCLFPSTAFGCAR